jgi:hypothetical protein
MNDATSFLRTQAPATAAFFALLLAAVVFRLQSITRREDELRDIIHGYMKRFMSECGGALNLSLITELSDKFRNIVKNREASKIRKQRKELDNNLVMLGRLWTINELATCYSASIIPPRFLKIGQIKTLRTC